MAKSHVVGWASDAPTPAQLKEFFAQIADERITRPILQDLLRGELQKVQHPKYSIPAYRGESLERLIANGAYDTFEKRITEEAFPMVDLGAGDATPADLSKDDVLIELINYNWSTEFPLVIFDLFGRGYQPARIEELLIFGAHGATRNLQLDFPVIALGSEGKFPWQGRTYPYLGCEGGKRVLRIIRCNDHWPGVFRFAAVRTSK